MFRQTIKINKELMAKVKQCSDAAGYSSADEFVQHILEKEVAKIGQTDSDEEIVRKLKGLGYLD
jgi:metal-responsive CopG/Arc/MetJ family transcriptional regulator